MHHGKSYILTTYRLVHKILEGSSISQFHEENFESDYEY